MLTFKENEAALQGAVARDFKTASHGLDGDTLTICYNAPKLDEPRPTAFEAKSGSGYDLITFKGAKP
jgi:hypothetical protein